MQKTRMEKSVAANRVVNALIAMAVALVIANVAWGLDTQDITIEWTDAGKKSPQSVWPTGKPRMTWSLCRPVNF